MNASEKPSSKDLDETVLWDVVEEHLERLDSSITAFLRAHTHPLTTFPEVARGIERRLLTQLDGLLVAGPAVVRELPGRMADPVSPSARTLALVASGLNEAAARLFSHEDRNVRLGAVRGASWAASECFDGVVSRCFAQSKTPGETGAWLELMGLRDRQPHDLAAFLTSTEPDVAAGALRCLRGPAASLVLPVERLMEHREPLVRERALRVALAWGSPRAWECCEAQALDSQQLSVPAMTAYALLGGPTHRERLSESIASKGRLFPVLRALGFSGSPDVVPMLLERLGANVRLEAKVAAQALVAITGLDFRKDDFAAPSGPEKAESFPPLEQDDLDTDLVPPPEEALPVPSAGAIRAWWSSQGGTLKGARRLVLGNPRSPATLFDALGAGPAGLRGGWAMALHLSSGGRFWLDVEGLLAAQCAQLAAAREAAAKWADNRLARE